MTDGGQAIFEFDAFISYSRHDIEFARRLETALEAYRPPRDLPVPQRSLRIFRDEDDFTGTEYLVSLERNLKTFLQAAPPLLPTVPQERVRRR